MVADCVWRSAYVRKRAQIVGRSARSALRDADVFIEIAISTRENASDRVTVLVVKVKVSSHPAQWPKLTDCSVLRRVLSEIIIVNSPLCPLYIYSSHENPPSTLELS